MKRNSYSKRRLASLILLLFVVSSVFSQDISSSIRNVDSLKCDTQLVRIAVDYEEYPIYLVMKGYAEGMFCNDKKNGKWRYFHNDGKLKSIIEFKDGKYWNQIAEYDSLGNELILGNLQNGTGVLKVYFPDGVFSRDIYFKDGNPTVLFYDFYNNTKIDIKRFNSGNDSTIVIQFSKRTGLEILILNNKRQMFYKSYYLNGIMRSQKILDVSNGIFSYYLYYPSGRIKTSGYLKEGSHFPCKKWVYYSKHGKVKKVKQLGDCP